MRTELSRICRAAADLDAKSQSGLYDLFRVGSKMLEHPTTRETLRLARATAKAITGCSVPAVYVTADDRLVRYSGKASRRLDLLVEARAGTSGVLENGDVWRYALFFRETGKVRGAFVLQAAAEPSGNEMFMLHALAEPTGAALATAELIKRERRQAREFRQLYEAQAGSNRTMAATIVRLNAHQDIRDTIVAAAATGNGEAQIVEALSAITRRSVVLHHLRQRTCLRRSRWRRVAVEHARARRPDLGCRTAEHGMAVDWHPLQPGIPRCDRHFRPG